MHTDDHILETFLASNKPLAAIASDLSITLIALVHWMDKNVDLLAVAKRAMETHIAFLALKAEAAALVDLTNVSSTTTNEERKRKSASQLLRHSAKRLLPVNQRARSVSDGPSPANAASSPTNPTRERGAPCACASPADLLNQLACSSSSPPSPRPSGEKSLSAAKGMRGSPNAELSSTNPTRERGAPCACASPADILHPSASSSPNAECPMPNAASFSDHEIDVLMATLANHFNIDLATLAEPPDTAPLSRS